MFTFFLRAQAYYYDFRQRNTCRQLSRALDSHRVVMIVFLRAGLGDLHCALRMREILSKQLSVTAEVFVCQPEFLGERVDEATLKMFGEDLTFSNKDEIQDLCNSLNPGVLMVTGPLCHADDYALVQNSPACRFVFTEYFERSGLAAKTSGGQRAGFWSGRSIQELRVNLGANADLGIFVDWDMEQHQEMPLPKTLAGLLQKKYYYAYSSRLCLSHVLEFITATLEKDTLEKSLTFFVLGNHFCTSWEEIRNLGWDRSDGNDSMMSLEDFEKLWQDNGCGEIEIFHYQHDNDTASQTSYRLGNNPKKIRIVFGQLPPEFAKDVLSKSQPFTLCTGDQSLSLALSYGHLPVYLKLPHKGLRILQAISPNYPVIDGADLSGRANGSPTFHPPSRTNIDNMRPLFDQQTARMRQKLARFLRSADAQHRIVAHLALLVFRQRW